MPAQQGCAAGQETLWRQRAPGDRPKASRAETNGLFFPLSVTFLRSKSYRVSSDKSVVLPLMSRRHFSLGITCHEGARTCLQKAGSGRTEFIHPNAVFSFKEELFLFSLICPQTSALSPLPTRQLAQRRGLLQYILHDWSCGRAESVSTGHDGCTGIRLDIAIATRRLCCDFCILLYHVAKAKSPVMSNR